MSALSVATRVAVAERSERVDGVLLLLAASALAYAVLWDQGQLLALLSATGAAERNELHELFHDGRHLLGVVCH